MADRLINAIKKAETAAQAHKIALEKVHVLFEKRYGFDFSAGDCDPLIDAVEGQGRAVWHTLHQLDEMVKGYCPELAALRNLQDE